MVTGPLVVVGDCLLDRDLVGQIERLAPDAPVPVVDELQQISRPGGAGLAALLAARDGRAVTLVTALSDDAAGEELAVLLAAAGIEVVPLVLDGRTPEKVRVRSGGRSLLRLDHGGRTAPPVGPLTPDAREALAGAGAVLVADYGRGVAGHLTEVPRRVPVVWDPHPRGPEPLAGCTLVTPNSSETEHFAGAVPGRTLSATTARAQLLRRRWGAGAVAVTMSDRGALLVSSDEGAPLVVPAPKVACFDPCGAGDRFASAAAGLLADGALPSEAVAGAVAVSSAFVADGGAATVRMPVADGGAATVRMPVTAGTPAGGAPTGAVGPAAAAELVARVRSSGGTVVSTGGCFDLLHAGHVSVLQAARALGDCLIVLLNSDASVGRLKGPDRPLVPGPDRAAVLAALDCVDAVVLFDEDTPVPALTRLRPDIWAKGGDYALTDLPEAPVVAGWGGQAVVLPYLQGRSTTAMLKEAARRG